MDMNNLNEEQKRIIAKNITKVSILYKTHLDQMRSKPETSEEIHQLINALGLSDHTKFYQFIRFVLALFLTEKSIHLSDLEVELEYKNMFPYGEFDQYQYLLAIGRLFDELNFPN